MALTPFPVRIDNKIYHLTVGAKDSLDGLLAPFQYSTTPIEPVRVEKAVEAVEVPEKEQKKKSKRTKKWGSGR